MKSTVYMESRRKENRRWQKPNAVTQSIGDKNDEGKKTGSRKKKMRKKRSKTGRNDT